MEKKDPLVMIGKNMKHEACTEVSRLALWDELRHMLSAYFAALNFI